MAPSIEQIAAYSHRLGFTISEGNLKELAVQIAAFLDVAGFERLSGLTETDTVDVRYRDRDQGRSPTIEEDPYNAIVRLCEVTSASDGPLLGKRVGIKDNIAVAGVPMSEGNRMACPMIPTEDAVVVERLLDVGASITAKTTVTLDDGSIVRNPLNHRYYAGASSSGSAAAVAAGLVDVALGTDQGGSIRCPAAYCGIVGMKPTHGLVPTYGLIYWDHSLDHIGPMTRTVADNAAVLEAIAGPDWRDPQCTGAVPKRTDYCAAHTVGIDGLRVGVVTEALSPSGCTPETIRAFEAATTTLSDLGATVVSVSIPLWTHSSVIWWAIATAGMTTMAASFGQGHSHNGRINTELLATMASEYLQGKRQLPWRGAILPFVYTHLQQTQFGLPFAHAQNLRLRLNGEIDRLFNTVDLIVTPTMPTGPPEIPERLGPRVDGGAQSPRNNNREKPSPEMSNTAVNLTGHPALTLPTHPAENDLSFGLQIIGPKFDEYTIYRAAFAVEKARHTM